MAAYEQLTPNSVRVAARHRATIGLDYGTHSTKVVCRKHGDDYSRIVDNGDSHPDYCAQTTPSFLRIVDGCLYFGSMACSIRQGEPIGSLKADLLDSVGESGELQQEIDRLTVCFLAWVLQTASDRGQLPRNWDYTIQLSIPTSLHGDQKLAPRYQRIVQAVYWLWATGEASMLKQAVPIETARELANRHLQAELEPEARSRSFIRPETIAPVVSFQLEPYLRPGIFMIADMGASTTELTVCAVQDLEEERVLVYSDKTLRVGGLMLDKIEGMPVASAEDEMQAVLKALRKDATQVWYQGFQLDRQSRAATRVWKELTIMLSGGGTYHREVANFFRSKFSPQVKWLQDAHASIANRHQPTTINSESVLEETDLSLFATANGLSVPYAYWPECVDSASITPLVRFDQTNSKVFSYLEIA